jgi:RNA polymerase sigma-70 factor (ECF subfamily)
VRKIPRAEHHLEVATALLSFPKNFSPRRCACDVTVPRLVADHMGEPSLEMERFRSYLLLLARMKLDRKVRGKVDASDVVQQTLLEAHQAMESFRGGDTAAQAAWLRQILARNLANAVRDLTRAKRDVRKERALKADLDASASQFEGWLAAEQSSPSQKMERQERALQLAEALALLPESQRDAVVLRHFQELSLAEIAEQLDCTSAAVAGLLQRGLKNLRKSLSEWNES